MFILLVLYMNTNNSKGPIELHNVSILGVPIDTIILFASIILPFINETAIVLRKSGLHMFQNLYKTCIHNEILLLLSESCKKNNKIHCTTKDKIQGLFIDSLAYLGILLNIGRNTIKYGYVTGVVNGFVLVICSIIFPNLYLGHIIHKLKDILNISNPIMNIILGLFCIIVLIFITKFLQDLSSTMFQHYRIDKINEPVLQNKTEEKIIKFLE